MAEWYCSSVAYAAIPQFAISTLYGVGDIVRRITPTASLNWVLRCTTAGTSGGSEPAWNIANNSTTATGSAVFTNVTGQSAYGWGAAAGDVGTLTNQASGGQRALGGDNLYLSSDHSETATTQYFTSITSANSTLKVLSVNRAGSVPPVVADLLAGATLGATASGVTIIDRVPLWVWGVTLQGTSLAIGGGVSGVGRRIMMQSSALSLVGASSSGRINTNSGRAAFLVLDNTTVTLSHTAQGFQNGAYSFDVYWSNTASATAGTVPVALFLPTSSSGNMMVTCRGVDLSAVNTILVSSTNTLAGKYLFEGCKINASVAPFSASANTGIDNAADLVGCFDGTNTITGRYNIFGTCLVNRTVTLASNASTDDVGAYSMVLTGNSDTNYPTQTIEAFPMDVDVSTTGSPLTATVEIVSSGTLTNADVVMTVEYLGTASSPATSFVSTAPATPLTAATNLTASAATWNSPPATPVYQKLQATFTPQQAGRCRLTVALAQTSGVVYVNAKPVIA